MKKWRHNHGALVPDAFKLTSCVYLLLIKGHDKVFQQKYFQNWNWSWCLYHFLSFFTMYFFIITYYFLILILLCSKAVPWIFLNRKISIIIKTEENLKHYLWYLATVLHFRSVKFIMYLIILKSILVIIMRLDYRGNFYSNYKWNIHQRLWNRLLHLYIYLLYLNK